MKMVGRPESAGRAIWPSRRRVAAATSGAVALFIVAGAVRAWSHPEVFGTNGGLGVSTSGWPPGDIVYPGTAGVAEGETGTVAINSASALPSTVDGADVAIYVCTKSPAQAAVTIVILDESGIRQACSTLTPAVGPRWSCSRTP